MPKNKSTKAKKRIYFLIGMSHLSLIHRLQLILALSLGVRHHLRAAAGHKTGHIALRIMKCTQSPH